MIQYSEHCHRQMARLMARMIGSDPSVRFYAGEMPPRPDDPLNADTEAIFVDDLDAEETERLNAAPLSREPAQPKGATFWRLMDIGGNVVMQGNWL